MFCCWRLPCVVLLSGHRAAVRAAPSHCRLQASSGKVPRKAVVGRQPAALSRTYRQGNFHYCNYSDRRQPKRHMRTSAKELLLLAAKQSEAGKASTPPTAAKTDLHLQSSITTATTTHGPSNTTHSSSTPFLLVFAAHTARSAVAATAAPSVEKENENIRKQTQRPNVAEHQHQQLESPASLKQEQQTTAADGGQKGGQLHLARDGPFTMLREAAFQKPPTWRELGNL